MNTKLTSLMVALVSSAFTANAARLFIPMDDKQTNHLRAYGIIYNVIASGTSADWLLNYRGGSFSVEYTPVLDASCRQRGVAFERLSDAGYAAITRKVKASMFNGDVVALSKVPRIAVYTPSGKKPWDDAVTLGLTYAGIPFDKVYVSEVLSGALSKYDWLHLHHEDFTGQYGRFWIQYKDADWYRNDCRATEQLAARHGFRKVSQMQLAVVRKIREFVGAGGNLFAMCSATDTYDIALAAANTDICDSQYDGDGISPNAQSKLNYGNTLAFTGFQVSTARYEYEYSTIDNTNFRFQPESTDYFTLLPFPAKFDAVPTMLCQNHTRRIKGFMGQTTAFRKEYLKPDVVLLGHRKDVMEARYIHGKHKEGTWTFYGGHDPEDYEHKVGEPPTDLDLHRNSPGYRLILNNVLCLASGKKDVQAVVCCETGSSPAPPPPASGSPFRILPGATGGSLIISGTGGDVIEVVTLVNKDGAEVYTRRFSTTRVTIDMDGLATGLYNIKVNGNYAGNVVKN